jgi:cysteine desulfurase/selenocysteine lyase
MPPYQSGGDMIRSVSFERMLYDSPPHRFEAGTPNIAGAVGLATAIDYLTAIGFDRIADYERELLEYATGALARSPGVRIVGSSAHNVAVLSFVVDGVHPHDVATILDREGVAIRAGHHCCQPLMERLGVPGTAQASLALYNNRDDIDALSAALQTVRGLFR